MAYKLTLASVAGLLLFQPALARDSLSIARQHVYWQFLRNPGAFMQGCAPPFTQYHSTEVYFVPRQSQTFYSNYAGVLLYIQSDGKTLKRIWCESDNKAIKLKPVPQNTFWKYHTHTTMTRSLGNLPEYRGPLERYGNIGLDSISEFIDANGKPHCFRDMGDIADGNPYFAPIHCTASKPKPK